MPRSPLRWLTKLLGAKLSYGKKVRSGVVTPAVTDWGEPPYKVPYFLRRANSDSFGYSLRLRKKFKLLSCLRTAASFVIGKNPPAPCAAWSEPGATINSSSCSACAVAFVSTGRAGSPDSEEAAAAAAAAELAELRRTKSWPLPSEFGDDEFDRRYGSPSAATYRSQTSTATSSYRTRGRFVGARLPEANVAFFYFYNDYDVHGAVDWSSRLYANISFPRSSRPGAVSISAGSNRSQHRLSNRYRAHPKLRSSSDW
eukprot:GHVU01169810.1.p1 GENE.GHVU01169810.1~~GHVU01169810.1.p1  ORF type:complete len:256 (-),score=13.61 GHVU01169810.1:341-1108(-)